MKYFILEDNIHFPNRWHLANLINLDGYWILAEGIPKTNRQKDMTVEVYQKGAIMDYTIEISTIPIVTEKVKRILSNFNEVEFFPVKLNMNISKENFYMLITKFDMDCVDEEKSEFEKFVKDDPVRPDLEGEYKSITKLIILPDKTEGKHIFRVKKFEIELIVSEVVKELLLRNNVTGIVFVEV